MFKIQQFAMIILVSLKKNYLKLIFKFLVKNTVFYYHFIQGDFFLCVYVLETPVGVFNSIDSKLNKFWYKNLP